MQLSLEVGLMTFYIAVKAHVRSSVFREDRFVLICVLVEYKHIRPGKAGQQVTP